MAAPTVCGRAAARRRALLRERTATSPRPDTPTSRNASPAPRGGACGCYHFSRRVVRRRLLRPLHGLGATYYVTRQFEDASVTLQRALDLSRNLDGLLNPGQLTILDPLIGSLVSLERHSEADREFQYAVRVAESAWGSTDPRVVRPVDRYAHWLEHMGRYPSARAQYARALTVGEGAGTRAARLVIEPLLGIARTYRLEATNGNEEEGAQYVDPFAQSGFGMPSDRGPRGPNPDRETAPPRP